jgi:hypothetical protein
MTRNILPWWLFGYWDASWTREERRTWQAINLIAVVVFLALTFSVAWASRSIGISQGVLAFLIVFAFAPFAWYAGRWITALVWPRLVQAADLNATKRRARR